MTSSYSILSAAFKSDPALSTNLTNLEPDNVAKARCSFRTTSGADAFTSLGSKILSWFRLQKKLQRNEGLHAGWMMGIKVIPVQFFPL